MERLIGIHAVAAALAAGRPLERLVVARGAANTRLQRLIDAARGSRTPLRFEARERLDKLAGGGVHQGVVAFAAPLRYAQLADVLEQAETDALVVALDGVEDPHNLGAVVRSADAAGALCVIVPERRAAGLTDAAAKAAAGALERLPVVRVVNINRALEELKEAGFWVYGLDERGEKTLYEAELTGRTALAFGGEGRGLHRLTRAKCDLTLRIPMCGGTPSLNVSVAAGVALFEAVRQRQPRSTDRSG